jgi:hypothetical protein
VTSVPPLCLACSILRHEVEALKESLGRELEVRYLGSMLHMNPELLDRQLAGLLEAEQDSGREVVLAYGDCCPRMLDFQAGPRIARTQGINCCELLLGRDRYRELRGAGAFFLMPEWALRWRRIFEEELGLGPSNARSLMGEMHTRLVYLDTGLVPVPREALAEASAYTGLPWSILAVDLEPLRRQLREALERAGSHE